MSESGFRAVNYFDAAEPHVCLYKDSVEIVLTKTEMEVVLNRIRYGYGYDAYFITYGQRKSSKNLWIWA